MCSCASLSTRAAASVTPGGGERLGVGMEMENGTRLTAVPGTWGGLGGGGSQPAPKAGPTACVILPVRHDLGPDLRLSGLTAAQTAGSPQTPTQALVRGRCHLACVYLAHAAGACGGFRALGQGTGAHLCSSPAGCSPPVGMFLGGGGGGCVCLVLRARAAGQGSTMLRLLGKSVGWVTCSFLQPTTEPPSGCMGRLV